MSALLRRGFVAGAIALAWMVVTAPSVQAVHRETPFLFNMTKFPGGNSTRPFVNAEIAGWVSFESTSDLMGNGSNGSEIFLQDMNPPRALWQVTNHPTGNSNNASVGAKLVAFDSTSDLLGRGITKRQIFLWSQKSGFFRQLTNGNADSSKPVIDRDGNVIAFESKADLQHIGATGNNIYLWREKGFKDVQTGEGFRVLTRGPGDSGNARWNMNGQLLAFDSSAPVLNGSSNGFRQIYVHDKNQNRTVQLTAGVGDSIKPSMNETGRFVVFQSRADLAGTGKGPNWDIFILDRELGQFRQLTSSSGDSFDPSLGAGGRFISFVSTGELGTGPAGQHLYLYDLLDEAILQVTRGATGSSAHPNSSADTIFFFDSDENPMFEDGMTGRQVYALNIFKAVPTRSLGAQTFGIAPGNGESGSHVRITTESGVTRVELAEGEIKLNITGRNFDGEAQVQVPASGISIPPVEVPSFGAICFRPTGNGVGGIIDCNGPANPSDLLDDLNVLSVQDHNVPASADQTCALGCRENDESCNGEFDRPHVYDCPGCLPGYCNAGPNAGQECTSDAMCEGSFCINQVCERPLTEMSEEDDAFTCPRCMTGTCSAGSNAGAACVSNDGCPDGQCLGRACDGGPNDGLSCNSQDECDPFQECLTCNDHSDCDPAGQCIGDRLGVCNGPVVTHLDGLFGAGSMNVSVPMTASISVDIGLDNVYCTADDRYEISDIGTTLRLTTGTTTSLVVDANDVAGASIGASEQGAPFDCEKLEQKDTSGARLVGSTMFLDVPSIPHLQDVVLSWVFASKPGLPCTANCPISCTQDSECGDGNACNGVETCANGTCQVGAPVVCTDGNPCNGAETCNPANGQCGPPAGPLDCDDDNPCTDDSCDEFFGCQHVPNTAPCSDSNMCTGDPLAHPLNDQCSDGFCVPGTAKECSDFDACNGVETCNPADAVCLPGTAPDCDDDNECTDDSCEAGPGCVYDFNTDPCDDESVCTTGDTCSQGICEGTLTPAAAACEAGDGNACDGEEACNPTTGACESTPLVCDDGDNCNGTETCNPASGCQPGSSVTCEDGNVCNGVSVCVPATGNCQAGPAPSCDDANPCTDDICDEILGCVHEPNTGGSCNDGSLCTSGDTCQDGVCVGEGSTCDDGDACNGAETCNPLTGACGAGVPPACDDGSACSIDSCDSALGCVHDTTSGETGVQCLLDEMRMSLRNGTDMIAGKKLQRKLIRVVSQAEAKFISASQTSIDQSGRLLQVADKKLGKFVSIVRKRASKDRIQKDMAEHLVSLGLGARENMAPLIAAAVGQGG